VRLWEIIRSCLKVLSRCSAETNESLVGVTRLIYDNIRCLLGLALQVNNMLLMILTDLINSN
jgi:hypothetical protein